MSQLVAFVKSFARNEEGQDLLEYALLVALIALIAIGAVGAAGGRGERHLQRDRRLRSAAPRSRRRGAGASIEDAPALHEFFSRRDPMQSPVAVMTLKQLAGSRFRRSEDGQDLLEYGLLMALDRDLRDGRRRDGRQHDHQRVLVRDCQQFLVSRSPRSPRVRSSRQSSISGSGASRTS